MRPSGNTIQRLVTSYFSLQAALPYRAPLYILAVVVLACVSASDGGRVVVVAGDGGGGYGRNSESRWW